MPTVITSFISGIKVNTKLIDFKIPYYSLIMERLKIDNRIGLLMVALLGLTGSLLLVDWNGWTRDPCDTTTLPSSPICRPGEPPLNFVNDNVSRGVNSSSRSSKSSGLSQDEFNFFSGNSEPKLGRIILLYIIYTCINADKT